MALEINNISLAYGRAQVVKNLSLSARRGDILCLVGPSGGGKSSLLRLIAGLETPDAGTILLDGDKLADAKTQAPPEERSVGMIFQDNALFPHMTIGENIAFGMGKASATAKKQKVEELLASVGLEGFAGRYPHTLSGGQQQRVALVRALARDPAVVLMDEPYANIDHELRRSLRRQARLALKQAGAIVVLVTHDPEEALEMGDDIAVLVDGEIVQHAAPEEIYENPATRIVAQLFGKGQSFKARIEGNTAHTDVGAINLSRTPSVQGDCFVVIRPEAITLEKQEASAAIVTDLRYAGDHWIACVQKSGADSQALYVKLQKPFDLAVGDKVSIQEKEQGVFVFPADDAR